jgi:3',5'-cyclic AMP phosphodiesterase CpdA
VQDLLLEVFPIIVHEDDQYVVVALNSNTRPACSVLEGAIGTLGDLQLNQLEELLKSRAGKCTVVLMHHHLGCPPEVRTAFTNAELNVLQLEEAQRVCDMVASYKPTVVLHGHKHVSYSASYKDAMILSGASVAYGDKLNKLSGENCYVYNIEADGKVSLVASKLIVGKNSS